MPSLKRTTLNQDFASMAKEARDMNDRGFCSPVSVAMLTGESFAKVKEMMEERGRRHRAATHQHIANAVLEELGFKRVKVNLQDVLASYPKPHCNVLKNVTTHHPRRFPQAFDPSKKYLAHVRGHVLAIIDGEVKDWSVNNSLRIYKLEEVVAK